MSRADYELRAIQAMPADPTPIPVDESEVPPRHITYDMWGELHDGRWYKIECDSASQAKRRRGAANSHGRRYGLKVETRQQDRYIFVRFSPRD